MTQYSMGLAQDKLVRGEHDNTGFANDLIRWPALFNAVNEGCLSFICYAFAESLLRAYPAVDDTGAIFLCYLLEASRSGHLCIRLENGILSPDPHDLWSSKSSSDLPKSFAHLLNNVAAGLAQIPASLIEDVIDHDFPKAPICRCGSTIYLQKNWVYETLFLKHLKKLISTAPLKKPDVEKVDELVDNLMSNGKLTQIQSQAIKLALNNSLTLICGGPGSGKSYTAAQIVKVFWESISEDERKSCEIAVAAPTGKAACNLYRYLSKALNNSPALSIIQPKTLHSLLGIRKRQPTSLLGADFVLVDEASMVDAKLMANLISSIKPGARLIFLGDPHQLPPVEPGSIFADMVYLFEKHNTLHKHCIKFTQCLRAELKDIVTFAEMVNAGDYTRVMNMTSAHSSSSSFGVQRLMDNCEDHRQLRQYIVDYALNLFPDPFIDLIDPQAIMDKFNRFRILSPLRKGFLGVEELNNCFLRRVLSRSKHKNCITIPIIIACNDYKVNLFNGEGGLLVRHNVYREDDDFNDADFALFSAPDQPDHFRKIPAQLLPKFDYAYCLSVHKSQGSEFDHVLLILPEGSEIFGREMFYTAATRAKKMIQLVGTNHTIASTLSKQCFRHSGIASRGL